MEGGSCRNVPNWCCSIIRYLLFTEGTPKKPVWVIYLCVLRFIWCQNTAQRCDDHNVICMASTLLVISAKCASQGCIFFRCAILDLVIGMSWLCCFMLDGCQSELGRGTAHHLAGMMSDRHCRSLTMLHCKQQYVSKSAKWELVDVTKYNCLVVLTRNRNWILEWEFGPV